MQKTDQMLVKLDIQKLHKTALSQQIDASNRELEQLRAMSVRDY